MNSDSSRSILHTTDGGGRKVALVPLGRKADRGNAIIDDADLTLLEALGLSLRWNRHSVTGVVFAPAGHGSGGNVQVARVLLDCGPGENVSYLNGDPTVRVRRDDKGNAVLDYEDVFPDDMGPLLICDASGYLRQVYRFWYSDRQGLRFLPSPAKRYTGLTIHHWDRGSGKGQFKRGGKERREIYDGIVRTITAIPDGEKILIVHFKKNNLTADIEGEIRSALANALGPDFLWGDRVKFCTWGKHTATNEFVDCKHVILASVLQYSVPQNEAHGRGAKKLRTEDDFSQSDFNSTRLGEIRHNIFQAACRGAVRRAEGDSCPEGCHLYIIYSTKGISRSVLSDVFPEATVEDWQPVFHLSPKKQQLADYLSGLATQEGMTVPKADLSTYLDIKPQRLREVMDDELMDYLRADRNIVLEKTHHSVTIRALDGRTGEVPGRGREVGSTEYGPSISRLDYTMTFRNQTTAFPVKEPLTGKSLLSSIPSLSDITLSPNPVLHRHQSDKDEEELVSPMRTS